MYKNKYISKLNLKFLDMKFLTIDPNVSSLNYSIKDKHNQSLQFPSIYQNSSQNSQFYNIHNLQSLQTQSYNKKRSKRSKTLLKSPENQARDAQNQKIITQIEKYRNKINQIKIQNQLVHTQIISLYHQKQKQRDKDVHVKKVKDIHIYQPNILNEIKSFRSSNKDKNKLSNSLDKQHFYQNIFPNSDKRYQQKLQDLKDKFISSNLHKNFQQYLINKNKRVPQFLKRIR